MPAPSSQPNAALTLNWQCFEGLQPYEPLLEKMEAYVATIRRGTSSEAVWLLEHSPIYTGGTSAKDEDLLAPANVPSLQVGRGGQWTWHGPGQRVAYVMLDLSRRGKDVRSLVQGLEGWIIASLAQFGINGLRRDGLPGVWVDTGNGTSGLDKIAAIGVRISRWVSWHGIAINVNPNLAAYDAIVPCGVKDGGVTSLTNLGVSASMDDLDHALKDQFPTFFP
jgi:lipoyl(octanoyl) transferase